MNRVNKNFGSSAESHAQWLIHQMKLSARYCENFEFKTFLEELCWKHCKYKPNKEWVSSRFTRFVCPALRFIPHEPRKKKDTHSLNIPFTFDLLTHHIIIVCQKEMGSPCGNGTKFNVKIWPWLLTSKSPEVPPGVTLNTSVKYHHWMPKGNGVIKPKR